MPENTNTEKSSSLTFVGLALALANDYESIYRLSIIDNSYAEYGSSTDSNGNKDIVVVSEGDDFFTDSVYNCHRLVYEEDQETFLRIFRKENVLEAIETSMSFTLNYRLVINGEPVYHNLKAIRGTGADENYIFIGVRNVDAQVRREKAAAAESETYSHIAKALASRYEVIYYIDITTNHYIEYSSSEQYAKLGIKKEGDDFFNAAMRDIEEYIHPEDCARVSDEFTREKFINNISRTGSLSLTYRQLLGGRTQYVSLLAVCPKNDPLHIIIGVFNIDAEKRRERAYREALGNAIELANHDPLTSVKNKHAYQSTEAEMNDMIYDDLNPDFAIAVFDVNGLKRVNDELGHIAGDQFIKSACEIICKTFKHSPVFRVGGDEFAVLLTGSDYDRRTELLEEMENIIESNKQSRLVTVSYGIAVFDSDTDRCMKDVFSRADCAMYEYKKRFKENETTI